ncbi:hypothetical protein [Alloactinosynnema sp. L-07]|nr:hypothetical protein [Alloactinosynnema sp. L-07]
MPAAEPAPARARGTTLMIVSPSRRGGRAKGSPIRDGAPT